MSKLGGVVLFHIFKKEKEKIYFADGKEHFSKEAAIEAEKNRLKLLGFENPIVWRIAYKEK